jgi:hypothetical protein
MGYNDRTAESYVNAHIEPKGKEVVATPDILLNKSPVSQDAFIREGTVRTPYFEISGRVSPVDGDSLIASIVNTKRSTLRARAGIILPDDYMKQLADLAGLDTRLFIQLTNSDESPVYQLEDLSFTGDKGFVHFMNLIPNGIPIYWNPARDIAFSTFDPDANVLALCGDVTSPLGIFVAIKACKRL